MVGGVAERVDVSEGEVKTCWTAGEEVDRTGEGGVELFPSRFESFSNAFFNLPFSPPLLTIFSVGSGVVAIGDCASGDERLFTWGRELVALAMGPGRSGVTVLSTEV